MKRLIGILLLTVTLYSYAQEQAPQQLEGLWPNCVGWTPFVPDYYCDCRNSSISFQFPLELTIADTVWFTTTVNDIKQGMSAYWFSDCSVTFEIYPFCSSFSPAVKMTVGSNQMREMDVASINRKIDEMGELASQLSQVLTPRVRVYPNGGTGKVYCYPYDQGPHSNCSDPLPLLPRMTYLCDQPDEVYELKPEKISSTGSGFFRWKQKTNQEAAIWLTVDSCNGAEIGRAVLSDSMRVFIPNAAQMKTAKNGNRSVFVHVAHEAGYVGRLFYSNSIKWDVQQIDTTICQGLSLTLADTMLTQSTVYTNDTLLKNADTIALTSYNLTVEAPEIQYDTLRLKAAQLPYNYRNQMIPRDGWGDYDLTIHQAKLCDERVLVHVEHDTVRTELVIRDTVCMGKTVTYGELTYTTDTVLRDSMWVDADTWAVRDISIHFTAPEPEYDTISVLPSQMSVRGYLYSKDGVQALVSYGDTLLVKTKNNTCTRWIYLTVLKEEEDEITTDVDAVRYRPQTYKYIRNGVMYIRREGADYDVLGRKQQ